MLEVQQRKFYEEGTVNNIIAEKFQELKNACDNILDATIVPAKRDRNKSSTKYILIAVMKATEIE